MVKIQESANRRFVAAIRALAQVRKLQASAPAIQYNTLNAQINLAGAADQDAIAPTEDPSGP